MQLLAISGSHRRDSQSEKVTRFLAARAEALGLFASTSVLCMSDNSIPFWSEEAFDSDNTKWKPLLSDLNDQLIRADAYIVVSPEWHGTVPSRLKNLLLFFTAHTVGHKPALLTAVSAARGGTYPICELRMNAGKNSRLCLIPEHLIVRNAGDVLNGDDPASDEDSFIRGRADFALGGLAEYSRVMKMMDRDILLSKEYANGM